MILAVVLSLAAAGSPLAAADWPQWRGPNRDGQSPERGLLDKWPAEGPNLLWKAEGLGRGFASVAVVGNRIYTMGLRGDETYLLAIDAATQQKVWETKVGENEQPPNCTPTVDGDRVYGVTFQGNLACCDARTGQLLWRKDYEADFGGRMMSGWGYSESPLIDGDRLICTPGADSAMLAALDKKTGAVIWQTQMPSDKGEQGQDGAAYSSIVISQGGGLKQYVQLVGRGVIGVAADNGRFLWGYNKIANGTANCPTPVVNGDFVFASTGYGDGGSVLLELKKDGPGRVRADEVRHYASNELQNHHGGMVLVGDYLYLGHGHNNGFPVCLNLKTGREAWRPGRGPGTGSAAVSYADGHLYFRYEDGTMALIEATPREYRLKGSFRLASVLDSSWPHPSITGGRLYIRDQDVLLCYDLKRR